MSQPSFKAHNIVHLKQQGVALVVSLILLVVITLLSLTAMRSTNLDTKITVNHQHKQMAFQTAENTFAELTGLPITNPKMKPPYLNTPGNINDDPELNSAWYTQNGVAGTPDLTSDLTMDYIEKGAPGKYKFSGFGLNIVTHVYQADAIGKVDGTNARSHNRMQVALIRE
jgi:type IV pilus assembly protein PilX